MKIIDTHTHLPGNTFGMSPRTADDLRAEFSRDGLTGAWLMTTDGLVADARKNNNILAEAVREHLDFFVPFCTVDPRTGAENAVDELVRCHEELGMRGLKLHPWLQAFSMTHPAVLPIVHKAGELGMPVLFHDGSPPYATPLQISAVAEKAPGTIVILGHAGLDDLYQDAISACLRCNNIYLCCCSVSSGYMMEIFNRCPPDKLMYGSDGGVAVNIVKDAINKIMATGASKNTLRKIFYDIPQSIVRLNVTDQAQSGRGT